MDLQKWIQFFKWCSILNGSLLVLWTILQLLAPDLIYAIQHPWFPMGRETFDVVNYCMIGLFKFMLLFLNLVPYLSLLILKKQS
ncbi:MAG: hypothetical protein FP816_20840 [Desulfobacteraceae bacterium]|nr:hypothetical protein [Desulfobacteraceae bacterium]MBU4002041.1 hypothetical protein [Pseudomonadota bacterium]